MTANGPYQFQTKAYSTQVSPPDYQAFGFGPFGWWPCGDRLWEGEELLFQSGQIRAWPGDFDDTPEIELRTSTGAVLLTSARKPIIISRG